MSEKVPKFILLWGYLLEGISIIERRVELCHYYEYKLRELRVRRRSLWVEGDTVTGAYFPTIFDEPELIQPCIQALEGAKIYPRRYFYTALSRSLPYLGNHDLPITDEVCQRVLCLPLYDTLSREEIDLINRLMLQIEYPRIVSKHAISKRKHLPNLLYLFLALNNIFFANNTKNKITFIKYIF